MLTKQLVVLAKFLKELGVESLDTIDQRMDAQKRVYLLQIAGVSLGYTYSWDLFGPYSRGLAHDLSNYQAHRLDADDKAEQLRFTEHINRLVLEAHKLLDLPEDSKPEMGQLEWLELIASIDHLARNLYGKEYANDLANEPNNTALMVNLVDRKPSLAPYKEPAKTAIRLLREHNAAGMPA